MNQSNKNKMTVEEILEVLEKAGVSTRAFGWGNFDSEELGLGDFEEVDQYGGEGQGDSWYSVKYFPKFDLYIRTDGFHSSHEGVDFDEGYGYEVKPMEKTITVYE